MMKVISAKPGTSNEEGAEGYDIIDVVIEVDGDSLSGQFWFEIDGRDLEFEGFNQEDLPRISSHDLWDEAGNTEIIKKALDQVIEASGRYAHLKT